MMIDIKTILSKKNNIMTLGIDNPARSFSRSFLDLTPNRDEIILFNHMSALCQK